jgi:SAM-dependent methyltransferase
MIGLRFLSRRSAAPGTSSVAAPPTVTWPDADDRTTLDMTCPNCGSPVPKPLKLTVNFITPDHPLRHGPVRRCPDCTCLFFEDQNPPDYTEESMLGRGRTEFYLQQGAGLSLICSTLARVRVPAGARYLDVGCGFGFGLDFARRAKGWTGSGIDPAGLSRLGRKLLGVPIALRYLRENEPQFAGACDVVMSSETIEHVPSPKAYLRTLRSALRPGGLLILTTPNAAEIEPGRNQAMLVPLLSPGLHLVLQNAASLRRLLEEAGFRFIVERADSTSLVFYASEHPFALDTDDAALGRAFRTYLEMRSETLKPGTDLFLGFIGRAMLEAANAADWRALDRMAARAAVALRRRFGIELETMTELPGDAASAPLERLVTLMPLNLASMLYALAIANVSRGRLPRSALGGRFACAAAAADALRRALGELAMEDGLSESLAWSARAEALLCDATLGTETILPLLAAMPPAPGIDGVALRESFALRTLAFAVNSGHHELGARLAYVIGLEGAAWADPPPGAVLPDAPAARLEALFCLGVLDTAARPPERARAVRRFDAVWRSLAAQDPAAQHPEAQHPAAQDTATAGAVSGLFVEALRGALQMRGDLDDRPAQLLALDEASALLARLPPATLRALRSLVREQERALKQQLVTLTNAGAYEEGLPLAERLQPLLASPGGFDAYSATDRDATFALAVIDLLHRGEPARAAEGFARVREALATSGDEAPDLLAAATNGEAQAIETQTREAKTREIQAREGLKSEPVSETDT